MLDRLLTVVARATQRTLLPLSCTFVAVRVAAREHGVLLSVFADGAAQSVVQFLPRSRIRCT